MIFRLFIRSQKSYTLRFALIWFSWHKTAEGQEQCPKLTTGFTGVINYRGLCLSGDIRWQR